MQYEELKLLYKRYKNFEIIFIEDSMLFQFKGM